MPSSKIKSIKEDNKSVSLSTILIKLFLLPFFLLFLLLISIWKKNSWSFSKKAVATLLLFLLIGFLGSASDTSNTTSTGSVEGIKDTQEVVQEQKAQEETLSEESQEKKETQNLIRVAKVIDGDTIELESGERLRYIGIDTPETFNKNECFGKESTQKNKELVEGKRVRLEKDVNNTDKYGRLLRYVYLEDGTFVNKELVKQGYAYAVSYPPDIKYQEEFKEAQKEAVENNLGLWSSCSNSKKETKSANAPKSSKSITKKSTSQPILNKSACNIKGNISYRTKEKIYHLPNCPYYSKTKINTAKGERWFCTEQEAVQAGWRKAKNCP